MVIYGKEGEFMKKERYVLGLDIGISSVGWALLELDEENKPNKIKDLGVKIFTPGENVKTGESKNISRRQKRLGRRTIRRREFRVNCIRLLLSKHGLIDKSNSEKLSDIFDDLKIKYNVLINEYYKNKNTNPFILRKEGLDRKLSNIELAIILVHYAKNRGYKSNREDDSGDDDSGKIKSAISLNEELLSKGNYRTISEMFVLDDKFNDRIHNESGNYKMSVTREMVRNDLTKVLDKQILLGTISNHFKEEYIYIWESQRHYSKGPGGNSKYGGDLIERMVGTCKFTGLPRAPKNAPSAEIYVSLTKLVNLKYKLENGDYTELNSEQINCIIKLAYTKDKITYKDISKIIGSSDKIVFKDLSLSKKSYTSLLKKFKKEVLNLDDNNKDKIVFSELTEEELQKYNEMKNKEIINQDFTSLKTLNTFRKIFSNAFGNDEWNKLISNISTLDKIAVILTNYKTDEDIIDGIKKYDIDDKYTDVIINDLKSLKEHLSISLPLIYNLIPLMKNGLKYNQAMDELGYEFNDPNDGTEKHDLLLPINYKNEINNQRVIRSLSQTRKIINSIIKRYGMPYKINIETARELAKSMEERKKIENSQKENKENNESIKKQLVELLPNTFKNVSKVSGQDLLKYKLWTEQNNLCSYSLEYISLDDLFNNNLIQVDHILPYSRTFNDNYLNKTLVKAKYNQDKGNKTPYEWIGKTNKWEIFKNFVNSLNISENKKDNYLLTNLTPEIENEMRNQNLNDTKYISKYLTSFLKAHLNVPKVDTINGAITSKLRTRWGLNNLTHSLQSASYYLKDIDENNDTTKNRKNHLHHAMDACVIACSNAALIRSITKYEKFKKYFDNKTQSEIDLLLNNKGVDKDEEHGTYCNSETGEIIDNTTLKEYIDEIKKNNYLAENIKHRATLKFPLPYREFTQEVKARVFERDEKQLEFILNGLSNYNKSEIGNIKPIIPAFTKNKIGGSLHEETFSGILNTTEGKTSTLRVSVISEKFNAKKLEKLVDKNGGSKEVYETLKKWLANNENGEEAFKKMSYPIDKTGKLIKKIKTESIYDGKGHIINKKVVDKANIQVIEIFEDKETQRLFFAGLDYYDVILSRKDKNHFLQLWSGQGKCESLSYNDALSKYTHYLTLYKNDLVLVEKDNNIKGICYINGFSDGKLEINSVLGDFYDIVKEYKLFPDFYSAGRYPITISSIKSIKKLKLNTLGKIEHGL